MTGALWAVLGLGVACRGTPVAAQPPTEHLVRARLVSEHPALVPGRENWLALEFTIAPHWHLYWDGRNDSGMAPTLEWALPAGFKAGAILWPAPRRLVSPGGILDHVYEDRVTLLVPLAVPADAEPGAARLAVDVGWFVCSDVCLPGDARLVVEVPVGTVPAAGVGPKPGPEAPLFAGARQRIPKPPPKPQATEGGPFSVVWRAGEVELRAQGAERIAFYAGNECSPLRDLLADGEAKGDRLRIRLNTDHDGPIRLAGVLEITLPEPAPPRIFALDLFPAAMPGAGEKSGG